MSDLLAFEVSWPETIKFWAGLAAGGILGWLGTWLKNRYDIGKEKRELKAAFSYWITMYEDVHVYSKPDPDELVSEIHKWSVEPLRVAFSRALHFIPLLARKDARDLWKTYANLSPEYLPRHEFRETTLREALADRYGEQRPARLESGLEVALKILKRLQATF